MSANRPISASARPVLLLGGAGGLLIAMTLGLWGWYGTTVFFEVLRAGWAACF
jgi:hypothetical protein